MNRRGKRWAWELIRRGVFARDGFRCVRCGRPGRLECHHKQELQHGGTNSTDNLETLCRSCHIAHHRPVAAREVQAWRDYLEQSARA